MICDGADLNKAFKKLNFLTGLYQSISLYNALRSDKLCITIIIFLLNIYTNVYRWDNVWGNPQVYVELVVFAIFSMTSLQGIISFNNDRINLLFIIY